MRVSRVGLAAAGMRRRRRWSRECVVMCCDAMRECLRVGREYGREVASDGGCVS